MVQDVGKLLPVLFFFPPCQAERREGGDVLPRE